MNTTRHVSRAVEQCGLSLMLPDELCCWALAAGKERERLLSAHNLGLDVDDEQLHAGHLLFCTPLKRRYVSGGQSTSLALVT